MLAFSSPRAMSSMKAASGFRSARFWFPSRQAGLGLDGLKFNQTSRLRVAFLLYICSAGEPVCARKCPFFALPFRRCALTVSPHLTGRLPSMAGFCGARPVACRLWAGRARLLHTLKASAQKDWVGRGPWVIEQDWQFIQMDSRANFVVVNILAVSPL